MAVDSRVLELLDELDDVGCTPEQVCVACPELLPEVRRRWLQMCAAKADLDKLFPTPGSDPGPGGNTSVPRYTGDELPQIPGYEVEALLGRGGMGLVYKARHLRLNRLVALKMLITGAYAGPHERARFQREAEAAASLHHANIVQVHDVGDHRGWPYFTMELLEGGSLSQALAGTPQPVRQAAALVATLAEAVEVAHRGGIVHRDLKPANILLTAAGIPKVADFGLARHFDGEPAVTLSGTRIGTLSYMAPEQVIGKPGTIGPAADIYALGALLHELLTGRPPFQGETAAETERQVLNHEPVSPARLNPKVPRDLETICLKCLSKEPQRRYASAAALADDLTRFREGRPIQARPPGWGGRLWRWCRRRPTTAGLLAALLALFILMAGGGLWLQRQQAERQRRARAAVKTALAEVPSLRQQGRWPEAQVVLTQARSLLDEAGSDDLRRRLVQADEGLRLAAALEQIRLTPAIEGNRLDFRGMAGAYARAFENAGLDVRGEQGAVAARIGASDLRPQLVMALDHWAYLADAIRDTRSRAQLLDLAQRVDPDPRWGDRFRAPALWGDRDRQRRLAAEAQQRLDEGAPESGPPTPLIALLAKKLGQKDEQAEPLLRAAQARHPEDFWLNYALGEALRDRQPAEAVGFYRAALAMRPTAAEVHFGVSVALEHHGQVDEAIRAARKAIELAPNVAALYHRLGLSLQVKGQLELALAEFRRAVELAPRGTWAHHGLGGCLQATGRLDEAMAEFRRAIELDPEGGPAHFQLGMCWQLRGRLDEAMAEYRRATNLDPGGGTAHESLADALLRSGRFTEVRTAVRRAFDLLSAEDSHRPALQEKLNLCERMLDLDARLPVILQGKEQPALEELLGLAHLCHDFGRPRAAASLYAAVFAARPALADDLGSGNRYKAACAAARAADNPCADEARLGETERAGLRRQALDWLQADLAQGANLRRDGKSGGPPFTAWRRDTGLASVRDQALLAKLPATEREEWRRLWADVDASLAPDPLEQGRASAARRDWARAADFYTKAINGSATNDGHVWFEYATLLLLSGDSAGYAMACASMIERCGKEGGPRPYHVARACTLAPDAVAQASLAGRLSEKELQASTRAFWSLTEQGALAYRAGRFEQALPLFKQSLQAEHKPGRAVLNWLWLALTSQRLGKAEEARRWLEQAQTWLDQYRDGMPAGAEKELGLHDHDWLEAHVLRREAEALIPSTGPRSRPENRERGLAQK